MKLPLLAGLAVIRALQRRKKIHYQLKWTNDIYLQEKKLAGILVERRENDFFIGIGINVNNAVPIEIKNIAISLQEVYQEKIEIESLILSIVEECRKLLEEFYLIFKNIMPELSYDRMENFIRSSWIFVIFVGMLAWELLFMIAGIFVLKYEKKAYIAGYIAGMIVYFTFIRTISDYGDGKITLLGTFGLWLKNVSGAAAPLIWIGILLVFSVVLYMINYKLIMRQQVA